MIAVLRYGGGYPMTRLEKLEQSLGIPLPASIQWEIVCAMAMQIKPVFDELIRQAAQRRVLHNDDTSMTVLSLRREIQDEADEPGRTGIFTSGIVSTRDGRHIALFFTGRPHAGENLAVILNNRVDALEPPIQMCDALARNLPKMPQTLGSDRQPLSRSFETTVCRGHAEFPRCVPARAGSPGKGVSP
jgi:hypothetical protein